MSDPIVTPLPVEPLAAAPERTKTVEVYPSESLTACDNIHRLQRSFIIHNQDGNQLLEQVSVYLEGIMKQLGLSWDVNPKSQ